MSFRVPSTSSYEGLGFPASISGLPGATDPKIVQVRYALVGETAVPAGVRHRPVTDPRGAGIDQAGGA
jgi:hypothetical protein